VIAGTADKTNLVELSRLHAATAQVDTAGKLI